MLLALPPRTSGEVCRLLAALTAAPSVHPRNQVPRRTCLSLPEAESSAGLSPSVSSAVHVGWCWLIDDFSGCGQIPGGV